MPFFNPEKFRENNEQRKKFLLLRVGVRERDVTQLLSSSISVARVRQATRSLAYTVLLSPNLLQYYYRKREELFD